MKQVKDHLGITYPSIKAMCEAYGITCSMYNKRKENGWDLQDILIGKDNRITNIEKKKKLEQKHQQINEYQKEYLRKYYAKNREKVKEYQRKYIEKNREKVNKYQKEYRERKNGPLKGREKRCQDHLGITYPSIKAMYEAYGISEGVFHSRKKLGWDLEEILTKPVRNKKN